MTTVETSRGRSHRRRDRFRCRGQEKFGKVTISKGTSIPHRFRTTTTDTRRRELPCVREVRSICSANFPRAPAEPRVCVGAWRIASLRSLGVGPTGSRP